MKIVKQAKVALLVMLALSILPGCGKKKNAVDPLGGPVVGYIPGTTIPIGSSTSTFSASGSFQLTNTNNFNMYASSGGGGAGGRTFSRTNQFSGDQAVVYLNGETSYGANMGSYGSATVVVYMSATTVSYFNVNCGSYPVRAVFSNTLFNTQGQIATSFRLEAMNGCGVNI